MIAVETKGLSKQYKHTLAVDDISIRVPEGVKCGFLGRNGAGKTTTIKMLTGLKKPTAGSYSILGEPQTFGQRGRAVGYLPDVPNFYGYMTGAEFLDLCGRLHNIPTAKRKEQTQTLLAQVGLDRVKTRIATYSRGMKQRLGIAQAMLNRPAVIFMDEPVSALDPTGRREVLDIVEGLRDTTVVFSTHILADVEDICDYILIIEQGRILAQERLDTLRAAYAEHLARLTLYEPAHSESVQQTLAAYDKLRITRKGPLELEISAPGEEPEAISKLVVGALSIVALPVQSFSTHQPTLEEIFAEIVAKGGRGDA